MLAANQFKIKSNYPKSRAKTYEIGRTTSAMSMERLDISQNGNVIASKISNNEKAISGIRMKSSESIHNFRECKKMEFGDELYELACIIFAIPPTQASLERNFSALKYMFTDNRYNLAGDLLESLLLVHLNRNYFLVIMAKDIEILENDEKKIIWQFEFSF